jgi:hypothetical protein
VLDDPFALGCDSSTSPPEEPVVVLRCMVALPVAGMQFVELPVELEAPIEPVVVLPLVVPGEPMVPVVPTPAVADVPVPVAPVVLLPIVPEALVPRALVPVAPVPVAPVPVVPVVPVAAPLAVPPNVALMPVPESVRPVAPVALVIPGAGADSPMLPLLLAICPGGQGDMLLLLVVEPDVVCCAPTEPAMAAPSTSDMLMARHRTRWSDPVCEVDIIPSVSLPWRPRGQCTGGARRSRHRVPRRVRAPHDGSRRGSIDTGRNARAFGRSRHS